ncbi:transglycosylase SLT domain-containing protein [Roseomonas xinghualingensis]|uniref:transglycosylase SLT domain-containing protein n=1 Tax=Roseomonas xinghualingensis TaxID=2986475 RepID=UPI0021F1B6F9|nr:transglycosylase SLT domain-containing protein [Roseomonas sp. SXEYE001]MCV4208322.1 transglycosylase SLT domain-containing protein [Roseomonas sp. SXEYE001]
MISIEWIRRGAMWPLATFLVAAPGFAMANQTASELCLPAITMAERAANVPAHLLRSIAYVESGRTDPASGRLVPWPWTINAGGKGYFYETKEEAIAAVRLFQANGIQSIDVGCAQVNLRYHPHAFSSLEDAFDVQSNVAYAARFLTALRAATGSWILAAANYHSATPDIGFSYARKVMAVWPDSARYGTLPRQESIVTAARPTVNYGIYTPQFAARLRRMDRDLARERQAVNVTRPLWVSRPPAPASLRQRISR